MMECPACNNKMSHIEVNGVELDACKGGCGGVWFDNYEFKKFDEPHEEAGTELLNIDINPDVTVDHNLSRNCPKCSDITLMRRYFSIKKAVEIDECAGCGGIWLDAGELNTIRGLFKSEEDRREAALQAFEEMFGPQLAELKLNQEANKEKIRRIVNMLKYICPSHYIPGKQDWGSF